MSGDSTAGCRRCGSRDFTGSITIAQANGAAVPGSWSLCTPCFALASTTLAAMTVRTGPTHEQGLPARLSSLPVPGACDSCHRVTGGDEALLTSVPDSPAGQDEPLQAADYLLCGPCRQWWQRLLARPPGGRGRRSQPDPQALDGSTHYMVATLGLSEADERVAVASARALGHELGAQPMDWHTEAVYVVAAGNGRAAGFVANLQPFDRVRTVVVASPASLDDAIDALKLGAGDLLATPLSRQQVIGMFDRLGDALAVCGRDERTGLPRYYVRPRFGLPCHLVALSSPPGREPLLTYLALRRFLRGYDRVAITGSGEVRLLLHCRDEHLESVVRRVRTVLGPGYAAHVRAHAAALDHNPIPGDIAALTPGIPASAFFHRGRRRAAS